MKELGVFVSGTGSLLEAMIADRLRIGFVLADRPCRGLEIAINAGIRTKLLPRVFTKDFDRKKYTEIIIGLLQHHQVGAVAMAGFMTVLHQVIFDKGYKDRILNTHPALLPSFKGDHAVRDALAFGVKVTGCTIHIATGKLDDGRILAQQAVPVMPGDTEATLHERIKTVERVLYPKTIREFLATIQ